MAESGPKPQPGQSAPGVQSGLGRMSTPKFAPPVEGPPPVGNGGTETAQAVNRLGTIGLIPRGIDYDRLGQVMQQAVSAGIQDAAEGSSQPTTGRSKVPDVPGPGGARRGTQGPQGRRKGQFPATGIGGLATTIGAMIVGDRMMTGGGGGGRGSTPGPAQPQPVRVGAPSLRQLAVQSTTPVPGAPLEAQAQLLPTVEGGGGAGMGGDGGAAVAGAAEGGEVEAAAGGSMLRSVLGAGLMGFGASGIKGAWGEMAAASPILADILGPIGGVLTAATGAYEGINKIGNAIAAQRQQGAYYQGILGGTNLGGQSQRIQQIGFGLSTLGNLSGAQANALFQGTTALDMTGGQRQNAMDTAIQLYDQLGVSVQSSIQNIAIAAQSGNKELTNLAQAIDTVTQAAVAGQMNANVARQNFTQLYGAATQVVQGPGAATAAGGFAAAQAQGGQLIQGANTSGFLSQQAMQIYAANTGKSYGQIVAGIQQGTLNVGQLAQQSFTSQLNQSGAMDRISQAIDQVPGLRAQVSSGKQLTDDQIESVVSQMGANGDSQDFYTLQSMLETLYPGNTFSSAQAVDFAVEAATGRWDPGRQQAKIQQKWSKKTFKVATPVPPPRAVATAQAKGLAPSTAAMTAEQQYRYGIQENYLRQRLQVLYPNLSAAERQQKLSQEMDSWQKGQTAQVTSGYTSQLAQNAFSQNATDTAQYQQAAKAIGSPGEISQLVQDVTGTTQADQARSWYLKNVVQKGTRDPVMEQLLKNPDLNDRQTLFKVSTQGGGSVYATVQDLQQHYMKQVQSGNVTVAAAQNQQLVGTNLASIMGFQASPAGAQAGTHYATTAAGQAEQKRLAAQVTQQQKNIITVVPSQALLQWMQFNSNAGSNISIDNQTATNTTAPAYPTAAPPSFNTSG
jgi:hypothetical protein